MAQISQLIGYAALGYGALQLAGGSSSGGGKTPKNKVPPPPGSPGGLPPIGGGIGQGPMGPGVASGSGPIIFEAPDQPAANQSAPQQIKPVPVNVGAGSSGGSKDKKADKKSGSKNQGQTTIDTSTSSTDSSDDVQVAGSGSNEGSPAPDKGAMAADTAGVQSKQPDQITQELNQQQGYTRTATSAELGNTPELDLGGYGGSKSKPSSKDKKGGSGGFVPDNVPLIGGF